MTADGEPDQGALPGIDDVAMLAERFEDLATTAARDLPLYRHLCLASAADGEVAARLLLAPEPEQRVPTLLLGAVHDVLLGGLSDELAAWYGSITDPVRPIGTGADDPWPHFRRLALTDPDVEQRLRTRSTQTNEVGRCAVLLPALAQVAASAPGAPDGGARPLGLVEIGASAGLNLLLDRYGYCYRPTAMGQVVPAGDGLQVGAGPVEVNPEAFVSLDCTLRGPVPVPLPTEVPTIASRVGLDRHPVDLSDRDDARWLVACQWPDQPERVHRARAAVALAHGDHPTVIEGDAVDDLAPLVERVGDFALPVVVATWVLAYLPPSGQAELLAVLDTLGGERDLTLLFAEQPVLVPEMGVPPRPDGAVYEGPTALVRIDWRDGRRLDPVRLADMHPHGTWLEWLADHTG